MLFSFWYCVIVLLMACTGQQSSADEQHKEEEDSPRHPVEEARQLVIVIADADTTVRARMGRYEKADTVWKQIGETYPVVLGRTGLAWGRGLHAVPEEEKKKKEGDGKSPAGIFRFGPAFGYAPADSVKGMKWPYIPISENTQCIEDDSSRYYNKIIDGKEKKKDWVQKDYMLREDDLYKWGIFVENNTPAISGEGSCIFLHLWRGEGEPTAGCTAMSETRMLNLIQWLDPGKKPLMIQMVKTRYTDFSQKYELPTPLL